VNGASTIQNATSRVQRHAGDSMESSFGLNRYYEMRVGSSPESRLGRPTEDDNSEWNRRTAPIAVLVLNESSQEMIAQA
jgi:hypothetical protein